MADLSISDIKQQLQEAFGPTLSGPRDEGLDRMAKELVAQGHEREGVEATLAEMVEAGQLRYITEPVGGVGAGIEGVLEQPGADTFGMTDGRPRRGAVPASQQHGTGYWDLSAD